MEHARYNGKCKGCGKWHTHEIRITIEGETANLTFVGGYKGEALTLRVPVGHEKSLRRLCDCGGWFSLRRVRGQVSDAHECNNRCTVAKSIDCLCSCGGLNHGRRAL